MLPLQILLAFFAGFCFMTPAIGQITFVKTADGNNQTTANNRQAQQGGLSSDKKKSLSKYGPEDAFPGATEQEDKQRQSNRTNQRRSGASSSQLSTPASTPAQTPTATPITTQIAATPQPTPSSPAPTAGSNDRTSNLTVKPPDQPAGLSLVPVSLATAALLVFGALVYILGTLRKKLKGKS